MFDRFVRAGGWRAGAVAVVFSIGVFVLGWYRVGYLERDKAAPWQLTAVASAYLLVIGADGLLRVVRACRNPTRRPLRLSVGWIVGILVVAVMTAGGLWNLFGPNEVEDRVIAAGMFAFGVFAIALFAAWLMKPVVPEAPEVDAEGR